MLKSFSSYLNEWLSLGLWLFNAALLWALLDSGWSTNENREAELLLFAFPFLTSLAGCMAYTAKPPFRGVFAGLTVLGIGLACGSFLLLRFASGIGRGP